MQYHTERCSSNRMDPGGKEGTFIYYSPLKHQKNQAPKWISLIYYGCNWSNIQILRGLECYYNRIKNSWLTPRPEALGSRFSSGTSTSSKRIIPVAEALRENFPSIFGVEKPFMPRSTMKPRTLPSSHLAQTTAMSATGELVILNVRGGGGETQ